MTKINCGYCNGPAKLVTGEKIYPHIEKLHAKKFWLCEPCGAYVGCHRLNILKGIYTDDTPLGVLANKELRKAKQRAHSHLDQYWRLDGYKRNDCYEALAIKMGIKIDDCHIGMFNIIQCEQVVKICKDGLL